MRILILHGPNLNLLGKRQPDVYGALTQEDILEACRTHASQSLQKDNPVQDESPHINLVQSNHEGVLIDILQSAPDSYDGVVFNPAAYTHTSYALYDTILALDIPVVEVHLSDITAREPFRAISLTAPACVAQFYGHGVNGYLNALDFLATLAK